MVFETDHAPKSIVIPQSVDATPVTGVIDTVGYNQLCIEFFLDVAAPSSVITVMAVSESDTTSGFTAIAALTNGTGANNFTPIVPNLSNPDIVEMQIDLRGRKRYLQVSLASTTARLAAVLGILGRAEIGVGSTAPGQPGVTQIVQA